MKGDLVLIETSLLILKLINAVLMLISNSLHKKGSKVSIQTRSPPASLSFTGQATKQTTEKRYVGFCSLKPVLLANSMISCVVVVKFPKYMHASFECQVISSYHCQYEIEHSA